MSDGDRTGVQYIEHDQLEFICLCSRELVCVCTNFAPIHSIPFDQFNLEQLKHEHTNMILKLNNFSFPCQHFNEVPKLRNPCNSAIQTCVLEHIRIGVWATEGSGLNYTNSIHSIGHNLYSKNVESCFLEIA